MSQENVQVKLANRPVGEPKSSDFEVDRAPVPQPGDGEVLVRVEYISLDPAMRGWMNEGRSYIQPVGLGEVMRAGGVGRVERSNHPDFKEGDTVSGQTGAQQYAVLKGDELIKVDESVAPLPRYLGALGMPGMTAYFGLLDVGQPKAGDTVLVSGAAGA
ncbi:MAG: NADP-dependent oxidoreductase, partial [Ectothiorhodospiraceae bacterium]|nr:NADP-dependent oxidoreductase [Ectothiorhodospiraceae bacterium]